MAVEAFLGIGATAVTAMRLRVNDVAVTRLVESVHNSLLSASMRSFLSGSASPYLSSRAAERFSSEGDKASGRWKKLAKATEVYRAAGGYSPAHPINVRTGQKGRSSSLIHVLTSNPNPDISYVGGAYRMLWPGKKGPRGLETKLKTAQQGRSSPKTVPRRVAVIDEVDMVSLQAQLSNYLSTQWER